MAPRTEISPLSAKLPFQTGENINQALWGSPRISVQKTTAPVAVSHNQAVSVYLQMSCYESHFLIQIWSTSTWLSFPLTLAHSTKSWQEASRQARPRRTSHLPHPSQQRQGEGYGKKEDEAHWKQPVHPCPGAEREAVKVNERSTIWL